MWRWSALETADRVASGEVSAREVTTAHIERIDEVNPALNAVTFDTRTEALDTAAALDEVFARTGPVGPLHGVPVTIKENIDVAGQPTPNGLPALADLIAPSDSPLVERRRWPPASVPSPTATTSEVRSGSRPTAAGLSRFDPLSAASRPTAHQRRRIGRWPCSSCRSRGRSGDRWPT